VQQTLCFRGVGGGLRHDETWTGQAGGNGGHAFKYNAGRWVVYRLMGQAVFLNAPFFGMIILPGVQRRPDS
jgi:hypothetical protein